jgi:hypothetical protein
MFGRKRYGRGWTNVRVERRALGVPTALSVAQGRTNIVQANVEVVALVVHALNKGESAEKRGDRKLC